MVLDFNAFLRSRRQDPTLNVGQQPQWLQRADQASSGQGSSVAGQNVAAPGYSGAYQQPASIWATQAGTGQGFAAPGGLQPGAGWEALAGDAVGGGGYKYQTMSTGDPADTTGVQTKNPDGSTQHGGAPIAPAPAPTTMAVAQAAGGQQSNAWVHAVPEWTQGGGYKFGFDYNQQTGQWTPKAGQQRAGSIIGAEVGWNTPMYVPLDYTPSQDTFRFENGETVVQRAIRETTDMVRAHPEQNAQHIFEYKLANFARDAATAGQSSGFDATKFSSPAYGAAYDPNASYLAAGVVNPYTGRPAGNAQGQPGTPAGAPPGAAPPGTPPGTAPPATPPAAATPPVAAPGVGAGGQGTGGATPSTGGDLSDMNLGELASQPEKALAWILRQKGWDPDSGGYASKYMHDRYLPLVQGIQQVAGWQQPGGAGDQEGEIAGLLRGLSQQMSAPGGGMGAWARGLGQTALGNADSYLQGAGDEGTMPFYETLNFLNSFNANPLAQRALANQQTRLQNQYGYSSFDAMGPQGPGNAPQTFYDFLKSRNYTPFQPYQFKR